jgi:hypothetical protein
MTYAVSKSNVEAVRSIVSNSKSVYFANGHAAVLARTSEKCTESKITSDKQYL